MCGGGPGPPGGARAGRCPVRGRRRRGGRPGGRRGSGRCRLRRPARCRRAGTAPRRGRRVRSGPEGQRRCRDRCVQRKKCGMLRHAMA
ncbi:hypothetical protein C1I97_20590 [Streptomyces sp. NTH33]|nr:hypothetical protein C1I97_20590 [Streptomyces sp. NTH33]